MIEHEGIINRLEWMDNAYRIKVSDKVLQKTPLSFDVSLWELFWPLIKGAQLVIAAPEAHRNPLELIHTIQKNEVTIIHFVPSMLSAFLEEGAVKECGSLRLVYTSGEALPNALREQFLARF